MIKRLKIINVLIRKLTSLKETIFPNYVMDENEKTTYEIISKLLTSPTSVFKVAPISDVYYISNEPLGYNVKISDQEIVIINHAFSFTRKYPIGFHEILLRLAKAHVEEDRTLFEKEIFSSELEVLKKMHNRLHINE
jgi:hypothetical protein